MNGEFVAWEDAKVHVLTHALHYGTGVFEGVRAYETPRGTAVFRHQDHIDRLFSRPRMYFMDMPYSKERDPRGHARADRPQRPASPATSARSSSAAPARWACTRSTARSRSSIAVWEWGTYLGDEGKLNGVRGKVSSWRRIGSDALIPAAKANGQYLNSVLAKIEASKAGYEEGIMLDQRGMVCEGTGENLFVVKDGMIATPRLQRLDPRRHQPRCRRCRSPATSATRSWSATSRAASCTWPTRSS